MVRLGHGRARSVWSIKGQCASPYRTYAHCLAERPGRGLSSPALLGRRRSSSDAGTSELWHRTVGGKGCSTEGLSVTLLGFRKYSRSGVVDELEGGERGSKGGDVQVSQREPVCKLVKVKWWRWKRRVRNGIMWKRWI